ncbi:hypothetical protein DSL92_05065 [Billgrantia gudaonensis]|uniref:Uncharacterized protein n=1 Tax=Billgrantia gudaonensis TaxID=376427 RepID=A0A3S0VST4_9GAMM|nr:hypothetical protein DSL92_05065 [Halomonas gudaonensis]
MLALVAGHRASPELNGRSTPSASGSWAIQRIVTLYQEPRTAHWRWGWKQLGGGILAPSVPCRYLRDSLPEDVRYLGYKRLADVAGAGSRPDRRRALPPGSVTRCCRASLPTVIADTAMNSKPCSTPWEGDRSPDEGAGVARCLAPARVADFRLRAQRHWEYLAAGGLGCQLSGRSCASLLRRVLPRAFSNSSVFPTEGQTGSRLGSNWSVARVCRPWTPMPSSSSCVTIRPWPSSIEPGPPPLWRNLEAVKQSGP